MSWASRWLSSSWDKQSSVNPGHDAQEGAAGGGPGLLGAVTALPAPGLGLGTLTPPASLAAPRLRGPSHQPGGRPGPLAVSRGALPPRAQLAVGEQGLSQRARGLRGPLPAGRRGAGLPGSTDVHLVLPLHPAGGGRSRRELLRQEAPGAGLQVEDSGPCIRLRVTAVATCTEQKVRGSGRSARVCGGRSLRQAPLTPLTAGRA